MVANAFTMATVSAEDLERAGVPDALLNFTLTVVGGRAIYGLSTAQYTRNRRLAKLIAVKLL